jgi:hypothetical protein
MVVVQCNEYKRHTIVIVIEPIKQDKVYVVTSIYLWELKLKSELEKILELVQRRRLVDDSA